MGAYDNCINQRGRPIFQTCLASQECATPVTEGSNPSVTAETPGGVTIAGKFCIEDIVLGDVHGRCRFRETWSKSRSLPHRAWILTRRPSKWRTPSRGCIGTIFQRRSTTSEHRRADRSLVRAMS